MASEISQLGQSALSAWHKRDPNREARLASTATVLSNLESAVDASQLFPELATALGEAVRQFEHGSIALLMNLTPLAADAGRRMIEVAYYTVFLRTGPMVMGKATVSLGTWHSGAALYSFTGPLQKYYKTKQGAATGPFGTSKVLDLYKNLSAYVHGNPKLWSEGRVGLELSPNTLDIDRHELWLTEAAKACAYIVVGELPDLSVDELDTWFGADWSLVKAALNLP